ITSSDRHARALLSVPTRRSSDLSPLLERAFNKGRLSRSGLCGYAGLVDLKFGHLVPLGFSVNFKVDDIGGFYQVLREFFTGALEVIALDVSDVFAIFVCFH